MNSTTTIVNINSDLYTKYYFYGWGRFRYSGILNKPLFAYIILCICLFTQNFSVNGANNAVISTVERVFYLNSAQSGLFLALYDLATVFSAPLVGYLGSLYSSPIFFSLNMTNLNWNNTQNSFTSNNVLFQCYNEPLHTRENTTDSICLKEDYLSIAEKNAKFLLYAGNFINGIGSVALFTIGVPYIERIFPREKAAYCQGIYFAVGTVGGALGILATGRFLLLYKKFTLRRHIPSWLTNSHPLWIGCWWLPYFIYGSLCCLMSLVVSGLPNFGIPGTLDSVSNSTTEITAVASARQQSIRQQENDFKDNTMVTTCLKKHEIEKTLCESFTDLETKNPSRLVSSSPGENNTRNGIINHGFSTDNLYNQLPITDSVASMRRHSNERPTQQETNDASLRRMCCEIWKLLKNIRCIFIIIANLFEGILLKGFLPFITKYFEYQHQLDTSTATLITGAIAFLIVIIGCPAGAYFMNKYSWTPMQCARICGIILIGSSFLFLFLIFSCPELKFQNTSCTSMNTPCCNQIYYPVCDIVNPHQMFLSPCHFGCINQTIINNNNNTIVYSSCHCAKNIIVSETACRFRKIPCKMIFALTLLGATLLVFFTAFVQVQMLQVLLHSVPISYQNMALALRQYIVRVLGQTSGPLLFGYVFDQACLVWLTDCYARRTCKVYDNRRMGLSMALS
ncbi:unnamed protein product, partial [Rotaria magnacalcarata]